MKYNKEELKAIKDIEELIKSIGDITSEYLKECEPENYKLCMSLTTVLGIVNNSYKVKFKVGEKAKLRPGLYIGCSKARKVVIERIEIGKNHIEYYVNYRKDGKLHSFHCALYEKDLIKLEE